METERPPETGGNEPAEPPMEACPDCGAVVGDTHSRHCDVERCSVCGGQRLSCDCAGHDPQFAAWDGYWPGVRRAAELGVDLNGLYASGEHLKIFVKPEEALRPCASLDADAQKAIDALRAEGWTVAVHNEYRTDGVGQTFQLMTHPSGFWIKGEGRTDADAARELVSQATRIRPVVEAGRDLVVANQTAVKALVRVMNDVLQEHKVQHGGGFVPQETLDELKRAMEATIFHSIRRD